MSISIEQGTCIGCGACANVCPGNLIALDEGGRAFMRRPEDCWGCTACIKECPVGAIVYFLGADMGGRGTTLGVRSTAAQNVWTFTKVDGTRETIVIDRTEANKY